MYIFASAQFRHFRSCFPASSGSSPLNRFNERSSFDMACSYSSLPRLAGASLSEAPLPITKHTGPRLGQHVGTRFALPSSRGPAVAWHLNGRVQLTYVYIYVYLHVHIYTEIHMYTLYICICIGYIYIYTERERTTFNQFWSTWGRVAHYFELLVQVILFSSKPSGTLGSRIVIPAGGQRGSGFFVSEPANFCLAALDHWSVAGLHEIQIGSCIAAPQTLLGSFC